MLGEIFRIDWYPQKSFIAFSHLNAEQIGVCTQIINLVVIKNGPIENNAKFIGKSCNIIKSKAAKIIKELLECNEIYLTENGKISHLTADVALQVTRNRMEEYSKSGQKGAKKRWHIKEKQEVNNSEAISSDMASTNQSTNINNSIKMTGRTLSSIYDIDFYLTDEAREAARGHAPGWDQRYLMDKFNDQIKEGRFQQPKHPNLAYPNFCANFTKGKTPI